MPPNETKQPYFLWLDLEMTGLEATTDRILEAAVIVSNHDWEEVFLWESAVVQPKEVLAGMNEWCQTHHKESGLLDRIPTGITEAELDEKLADIVSNHWGEVPAILCGNSIHQDRKFVDQWLPQFASKLHYRMLDVSSFKVAFQELYDLRFEKKNAHRALDDIRESITEFRFYLERVAS
ncbi:oligoribonuclease [Rubellicoccus peritrichatus]|uniref:Oligoribonuclease n=1 Tax=Rubellicoccus peritrichatus TaxID=3080537 RepID=A0AAQ3LGX9_9BACT|nr:oligoribonuclease [Puniceicoccus sp. CR14]WOO43675.1 oligoribonuclease [Puniceicoccus sp. CR14]